MRDLMADKINRKTNHNCTTFESKPPHRPHCPEAAATGFVASPSLRDASHRLPPSAEELRPALCHRTKRIKAQKDPRRPSPAAAQKERNGSLYRAAVLSLRVSFDNERRAVWKSQRMKWG
ncbi:hypothetical protein Droror1_Dr00009544 [Drosera rotundifolia]